MIALCYNRKTEREKLINDKSTNHSQTAKGNRYTHETFRKLHLLRLL